MSDDRWRRHERSGRPRDRAEFGGPLFPDEPPTDARHGVADDTGERRLQLRPERHRAAAALDRSADR